MGRVPSIEADNHGNGNAEAVRISDALRDEDDERRAWLNSHQPRFRKTDTGGGPCSKCGRPLSVKNKRGICTPCADSHQTHRRSGPRHRG